MEEIKETVAEKLRSNSRPADDTNPNCYAQYVLDLVEPAIKKYFPVSRPSPYAKRWWTEDLAKLRKDYTCWRKRARATRRVGARNEEVESNAKAFKERFHGAVRKQKKTHW